MTDKLFGFASSALTGGYIFETPRPRSYLLGWPCTPPHLPALALAFAIFISSAFAGQNFKPMELPKTGLTEEQISAKADCLVWFTAEYVGNSDGLSADTILRWHREQFRKMRPASREWAKALGNSTQPQTVDWVLRMFMGEDAKLIRYAYQKCFVDNEEPGDLGLD